MRNTRTIKHINLVRCLNTQFCSAAGCGRVDVVMVMLEREEIPSTLFDWGFTPTDQQKLLRSFTTSTMLLRGVLATRAFREAGNVTATRYLHEEKLVSSRSIAVVFANPARCGFWYPSNSTSKTNAGIVKALFSQRSIFCTVIC